MSAPTEQPAEQSLSTKISAAVASVWTNYADGDRPTDVRTEIRGDVVTCFLPDAVENFERGMAAMDSDDAQVTPPRTRGAFRRDASAAVRRVTHRRVSAFISKHDAKTDVATEVFILDPMRR